MDNEGLWIEFFGKLIKNITGVENILVDGREIILRQENIYPKIRFSLTEIEKSVNTVVSKDKKIPSKDDNFESDIERSYIYTPLWLCSINLTDKKDNKSLDKVGRLVLSRGRLALYLRKYLKENENYEFYKNSSFKKAKGQNLNTYENSQPLFYKKLNIEFTFNIVDKEILPTIESVKTEFTIK